MDQGREAKGSPENRAGSDRRRRKHVVAAVIERDGLILIAQRRAGDHLELKWEFPGGKVEKGESPEESLVRELYEEFGIQTQVGPFLCDSCFDYPDVSIRLSAYRTKYMAGRFELTEHEQVKWVPPDDLLSYDLAAADVPIVEKLLQETSGT
jgi:8-oxo-dGTP diphosphatase